MRPRPPPRPPAGHAASPPRVLRPFCRAENVTERPPRALPGFQHTAFSFGYESAVHKASINAQEVPPGALVSFIQKGLQYLELEANLTEVRPCCSWRLA